MKIKELFTSVRVIIFLIFIILSLIVIRPSPGAEGVAIRSIALNSSASLAGVPSVAATTSPMSRERITEINNEPIKNEKDYYSVTSKLEIGDSVQIKTNKGFYRLTVLPEKEIIVLNETEKIRVNESYEENVTINGTNSTVTKNRTVVKVVPKTMEKILGPANLGLNIYDAPKSNIKKGLDLQGGIRVLLQPEKFVNADDMDLIITNLKERLNVFGLSDIIVREATDLSGNQFILIEMAGAEETSVKDLIAKQGVFEAKIKDKVAFSGGKDITYVCRSAQCSGIDPRRGCGPASSGGYSCGFRFSISLSPEAAQRQAAITAPIPIISDEQGQYLEEKLRFVLDGEEVDALNIGADLKGVAATDISISGGGEGVNEQAALQDALTQMKRMQTILITGSLPVKLNIVKTDTVSAVLGKEFVKSALIMGILAILAVSIVIFIRFKRLAISIPMLITMLAEVIILLGVASFIKWNIDLAAIAGILVAVGTGVDDQIVIADETLKGAHEAGSFKDRLKKAFFIIFGSYLTTVFAMVPLLFAGAGLVKGFALTTILGVTIGVFITRPAFAVIVEKYI